jgi:hypothetical protein
MAFALLLRKPPENYVTIITILDYIRVVAQLMNKISYCNSSKLFEILVLHNITEHLS